MPTQISVITLVRNDALSRLRGIARGQFDIKACDSAGDALSALRSRRGEAVVVLDPTAIRTDALDAVVSAIRDAGIGVMLFLPSNVAFASVVCATISRVHAEVLLYDSEFDSKLLTQLLIGLPRLSAPATVLLRLRLRVESLPSDVREYMIGLFAWLPLPIGGRDPLGGLTSRPRATRVAFQKAGLRPPSRVRDCARISRVWAELCDRRIALPVVASRAGFGSLRRMEDQFARTISIAPRAVHKLQSLDEFADRLAQACIVA
jgi:hypothetical protein